MDARGLEKLTINFVWWPYNYYTTLWRRRGAQEGDCRLEGVGEESGMGPENVGGGGGGGGVRGSYQLQKSTQFENLLLLVPQN